MTMLIQNHQRRPTRQLRRTKGYNIDLQDLLTDGGELDTSMTKWCQHRRDDGADVRLWSPQGKYHAKEEARRLGVESLFAW